MWRKCDKIQLKESGNRDVWNLFYIYSLHIFFYLDGIVKYAASLFLRNYIMNHNV